MEKKLLVIIMPTPPFQKGEEFLNDEFPHLENEFEKIIVVHHALDFSNQRELRPNVVLKYFPYLPDSRDKVKALLFLFHPLFWREISNLLFKYKLFPTRKRITTILVAMQRGTDLNRFLKGVLAPFNNYACYAYSYWCNYMAVGLSFLKREDDSVTCISRAHGYDVYFERNEINYLPLREFLFQTLDRVYFISNTGLKYTQRKVGIFPAMKVSYLGKRPLLSGCETREHSEIFTIVSCSSLIPLKRIGLLVNALSLIEVQRKIRWIHFGDGPLLEEIGTLASELLDKNHLLSWTLKGYVNNDEILKFYQQEKVDLFVNVSESEGIPFSIMEAFAAGIPAIATAVGGTPEIIDDELNGFLLSPNPQPSEIREKIEHIINMDEAGRQNLCKNANQKMLSTFNADTNYPSFLNDFL